jgi:hypothetical protein
MKDATKRTIQRGVHLFASIPILGYIYSPFENLPDYAPKVRFIFVPLIAVTGLLLWKGHLLRRFFPKNPSERAS